MRLSNEEFAAEVLRRSAQQQRADRVRRRRILMTVGSAAACLVLVIGISVRGQIQKNAAPRVQTDNADRPAANEGCAAEQSPKMEEQRKGEENLSYNHTKREEALHSGIVLSAEQTEFDLAENPQITVTVENPGTAAVTVSAHDFMFEQAEQHFVLPDDAEADSITLAPGESGRLTLTPADYIGDLRGDLRGGFTLVYVPGGAKLTLTFK